VERENTLCEVVVGVKVSVPGKIDSSAPIADRSEQAICEGIFTLPPREKIAFITIVKLECQFPVVGVDGICVLLSGVPEAMIAKVVRHNYPTFVERSGRLAM